MQTQTKLSFIAFIFLISFASVNAVLFTPALPAISSFFAISDSIAQQTISWFLIGYTTGQLIYGPLANRFGRKSALYMGISIQILGSLLCAAAGFLQHYPLLVIGRLLMALGSGAGLKITFTLINEMYDAISASRIISYLMIAVAVTPSLSVLLGSHLNANFGWESTFYASAIYGVSVLLLAMCLPETKKILDPNALSLKPLITGYLNQFKNTQLVSAGLLMGSGTCIIYVFASIAPFIAMNHFHMSSTLYGQASLLPPIGLIVSSIISAQLTKIMPLTRIIHIGIFMTVLASVSMLALLLLKQSPLISLFIPMILCYAGLGFINSNASSIAMSHVKDKANGSAVLNFTNMGFTTLVILSMGTVTVTPLVLPCIYIVVCLFMISISQQATRKQTPILTESVS